MGSLFRFRNSSNRFFYRRSGCSSSFFFCCWFSRCCCCCCFLFSSCSSSSSSSGHRRRRGFLDNVFFPFFIWSYRNTTTTFIHLHITSSIHCCTHLHITSSSIHKQRVSPPSQHILKDLCTSRIRPAMRLSQHPV